MTTMTTRWGTARSWSCSKVINDFIINARVLQSLDGAAGFRIEVGFADDVKDGGGKRCKDRQNCH